MEYYVVVTDKCNLACDYCFEHKNPARYRKDKPPYSLEKLVSFIKKQEKVARLQGPRQAYEERRICFYGGEPLLNQPRIKKLIEKVKGDEELKDFEFMIQTNGTLLNTTNPYILKNLKWIFVSIDGTKEVHDKHRKFPDGRGSYDIIMENLKWLTMQKYFGNFKGQVLARMTLAEDCAGQLYNSVTSLMSKKTLAIDVKKLRAMVGEKNLKKALKEIVENAS